MTSITCDGHPTNIDESGVKVCEKILKAQESRFYGAACTLSLWEGTRLQFLGSFD